MRTTAQLTDAGKVTIPAHIREELSLGGGDLLELDIQRITEADA